MISRSAVIRGQSALWNTKHSQAKDQTAVKRKKSLIKKIVIIKRKQNRSHCLYQILNVLDLYWWLWCDYAQWLQWLQSPFSKKECTSAPVPDNRRFVEIGWMDDAIIWFVFETSSVFDCHLLDPNVLCIYPVIITYSWTFQSSRLCVTTLEPFCHRGDIMDMQ